MWVTIYLGILSIANTLQVKINMENPLRAILARLSVSSYTIIASRGTMLS